MNEYVFIKRHHDEGKFLPVVIIHGANGNAQEMIDRTIRHIDRYLNVNTLLIFPTYSSPYQFLGNNEGHELINELKKYTQNSSNYINKICIYGFSAGAQFAHRFTYAYPENVGCCAVIAAGTWTLPDGEFLDHPEDPEGIHEHPFNQLIVHQIATRKANKNINAVHWIIGCGREDIRYEKTLIFYKKIKKVAPNTSFITYQGKHFVIERVYKAIFSEFKSYKASYE